MGVVRLGTVDNLTVYGGIPDDIASAWYCIADCHEDFFDNGVSAKNSDEFADFAKANIVDAAFARDEQGIIRCFSYIVREGARGACYHGFCDKDYRKPDVSTACGLMAIRYFFVAHWLERLSTCGRWGNRVARLYAVRQGFTIEGRLRKFVWHKGKAVDAYYGSILREEV